MYRSILFFLFTSSFAGQLHAQANDPTSQTELCDAGKRDACHTAGYSFLKGPQKNLKRSIHYFKKGCELENWDACGSLGYSYETGRGVPKDQARANKLFLKACENSNSYGCGALANYYEYGLGKKKDLKQALLFDSKACEFGSAVNCENAAIGFEDNKQYVRASQYYRKACDGGETRSCSFLGDLYYYKQLGKGEKSDNKKAFKFASEACNRDLDQCTNLAKYYFNGIGTPKNRIKAIPLYIKRCEIDGDSCSRLGYAFEEEKKYEKAGKFYQLGCEKNDAYSCNALALLYRDELGMKKNIKLTEHFYKMACHLKHKRACSAIAFMYRDGKETVKNFKLSAIYFEKACNLKHGKSCSALGVAYTYGRGVEKNRTKAATLYRNACNQGSNIACSNLALAYEYGRGIKKDTKIALSLHKKMCNLKSWKGCQHAGSLLWGQKKYQHAAVFFQQACDGDNNESCRSLGALHQNRHLPSPEKSIVYYRKACKKGLQSACVSLGLHKQGLFVKIDKKRADILFENACPKSVYACIFFAETLLKLPTTKLRTERAMKLLQHVCKEGRGEGCTARHVQLQKNGNKAEKKAAFEYFEKICKLSDLFCGELADSYRPGLGVRKNAKKSEALLGRKMSAYLKACEEGIVSICLEMGKAYQRFEKPKKAKELYQKACKFGARLGCIRAKEIR